MIQTVGSVLAAGIVALFAILFGVIGSTSLQEWTRIATAVGGVVASLAYMLSGYYLVRLSERFFGERFTGYVKKKIAVLLNRAEEHETR